MVSKKTADEQSKDSIADSVISDKQRYFVPEHNTSIEASSAEEAGKLAKAKKSKANKAAVQPEEEGDA